MTLYKPKNMVGSEIASGASFEHGTDSEVELADASDFDSNGGYIRIDDTNEWAIYEYTGISTDTLTGLTLADSIAESTSSHTFDEDTPVTLEATADLWRDMVSILLGDDPWPASQDAGDNSIKNLLAILNSAQSSAPSSPSAGDTYIDDGSNTDSGNSAFRQYIDGSWEDIALVSELFSGDHGDLSNVLETQHHDPANQDWGDLAVAKSDVDSTNWGDYEIQKDGTDDTDIINFKTS